MSAIKEFEPLWGTWYIESLLGEGSIGKVYKVRREESGNTCYAAAKIISIPHNKSWISKRQQEGFDEASLRSYVHDYAKDIGARIDTIRGFGSVSNIVGIQDLMVIEGAHSFGCDILFRMEMLTSFAALPVEVPLTKNEILEMGTDICRALEWYSKKKMVHGNIKPNNIFLHPDGEYKLGDFGLPRYQDRDLNISGQKKTEAYAAPEVIKGEFSGISADTYALGIVIYQLLNQNRLPFQRQESSITGDQENALARRLEGEPLPYLEDVSFELNTLLRKACAYNPAERFADPAEMRMALQAIGKEGCYEQCEAEVTRKVSDPDQIKLAPINDLNIQDEKDIQPTSSNNKKRKKRPLWVAVLVSVAVLLMVSAGFSWIITSLRNTNSVTNASDLSDTQSSALNNEFLPDTALQTDDLLPDESEESLSDELTDKESTSESLQKKFIVTYNYMQNGGTSATKTTDKVSAKAGADLSPIAQKNGWDFVGWNTNKEATEGMASYSMPESDAILYAIYKKTLTVTLKDYHGTSPKSRVVSVTIYNNDDNGKVMIPVQNTLTGWKVRGWSTSTEANTGVSVVSGSYTISTDTILYGLYQRTLTLKYVTAHNASTPMTQTGTQYVNSAAITNYVNPTMTLAKAVRSPIAGGRRYIFDGWALGSPSGAKYNASASIQINKDVVFYSVWKTNDP